MIIKIHSFIICICLVVLLSAGLTAGNPAIIDSLILSGDQYLLKTEHKAAKDIYQRVLKLDAENPDALLGLGKIALADERWEESKSLFKKSLATGHYYLENNYYLGICYRETGKAKAWILQKLDYSQSERSFQIVLEQDSLFRDVLYQRALLSRYRGEYEAAIQICQEQIRLKPLLYTPRFKLYRLYRYLITHRSLEETLVWLHQYPWAESRYFWGEKLRREGEFAKADSVFLDLLRGPVDLPAQPVLISLAKINYQTGNVKAAERYFWQSVNQIHCQLEADLIFEELKYIVSTSEYQYYDTLETALQFREFFRNFWFRRNPVPSFPSNIRLTEHFRRLLYAEKNYEYDGFRLWSDNPDKLQELEFPDTHYLNREFNDKGLVYIRQGDPDKRVSTVAADLPTNESWLYYASRNAEQLSYHFILMKPDNDWRLVPFFEDIRMYEDRLDWGNIYFRLLQGNDLERESYKQEFINESRNSVSVGLSTDRHSWLEAPLPVPVILTAESFRGSFDKSLLEISHIISLEPLHETLKTAGIGENLEQVLAVYNTDSRQIYRKADTLNFKHHQSEKYLMNLYQLQLDPDLYRISFHVRSLDNRSLGWSIMDKNIEDYFKSGFKISDLQVASFIEPSDLSSEFVKNGLLVIPNPTARFTRDKPLYLYFEMYNLLMNSVERVHMKIEYTLTSTDARKKKTLFNLFGLLGKAKTASISIQNEHSYNQEFAAEYLALDVSSLPAGNYILSMKVEDDSGGVLAERIKQVHLQ